MVRILPSFLRLQLRPHTQKYVSASSSIFGLEVGRIGYSVRVPHRISVLSPLPAAETWLVVSARKEHNISVWKRKMVLYLFFSHDLEKINSSKGYLLFKVSQFSFYLSNLLSLVREYLWLCGQGAMCTLGSLGTICMPCPFPAPPCPSPSSWASQQPCAFRKKGPGFSDATLHQTTPT